VIVESDHTHTKIPKPFIFEENATRFAKFADKIRYIRHRSQCHANPWDNEGEQRNALFQGNNDAVDDDIVLVSDLDEIPRSSVIQYIKNTNKDIYALRMPCYYYKLNFVTLLENVHKMPWSMAGKGSVIRNFSANSFRNLRFHFVNNKIFENYDCEIIEHAGWHFGYLGDNAHIKHKFVSYAHAPEMAPEYVENFDMDSEVYAPRSERAIVKIDNYFPATILNNLEKYQKYIAVAGDKSMKDYFER
jgi:hypothetical protein